MGNKTYLLSIQISLVIADYWIGLNFPFLETIDEISVGIFQSFQNNFFVHNFGGWLHELLTSREVFFSNSLIDQI